MEERRPKSILFNPSKLILLIALFWLPPNIPLVNATLPGTAAEEIADLKQDLLADFQVLQDFFDAAEPTEFGLWFQSPSDIDQAVQLLSTAFAKPLAFDLVTTYCIWDPEREALYLQAMESIPLLLEADLPRCRIQKQDEQFVVHCPLTDCYQIGDSYIYIVTLEKANDHWIINDLKLQLDDALEPAR